MAQPSNHGRKNKASLMVRHVREKLQRNFGIFRRLQASHEDAIDMVGSDGSGVLDDVKEGHFVVCADDGVNTPKRFAVKLGYLSHPKFLKLLDKTQEKFGFEQKGTLSIPCLPRDLQKILDDGKNDGTGEWGAGSCSSTPRGNDSAVGV
ncbi:hypothetical protein ACLOJK_034951 [Asimina triloba]